LNAVVLLLVLTSFPLGILGLVEFRDRKHIGPMFSMIAAAWSIAGVILVSAGVSGLLFFPVLLVIMLAGDVLEYRSDKRKFTIVKGLLVSTVLAVVTAAMVIL